MAYLKKEQYEYRRRSAESRNADNKQLSIEHGMTEEQANLIWDLCRVRHELHTNMDKVIINDSYPSIKKEILNTVLAIEDSGLPGIDGVPVEDYGELCIDIDDMNSLFESEDWPESGTPEWQDKYDDEYYRISNELEELNNSIEKYLANIDKQYGTNWCPTGALRIM